MAVGDDAIAAGMANVNGATTAANTLDTEVMLTRDYIAQGKGAVSAATANKVAKRDASGRLQVASPVATADVATKGYVDGKIADHTHSAADITSGTLSMARIAAQAITGGKIADGAIDVNQIAPAVLADIIAGADAAESATSGVVANAVAQRNASGQIGVADPTSPVHAATKAYVDSRTSGIDQANGPTSAAYNRNATGSGWFAVYMNSALQFMRNTSSKRYKKRIRDWSGSALGLRTTIFDRRADKNTPADQAVVDEVGFIAEEVLEVLPEAVMYFDGQIDGINERVIIAALVNDVQRLAAEVAELKRTEA